MTAADRPSVTDDARVEAEREARAMRQRTALDSPSPLLLRVRHWFVECGGSGKAFDWAVNGYADRAAGRAETTTAQPGPFYPGQCCPDGYCWPERGIHGAESAKTAGWGGCRVKWDVDRAETTTATTEDAARVEALALRLWDEGIIRPEYVAMEAVEAILRWLAEDGLLASPSPARTAPTDTTKETS